MVSTLLIVSPTTLMQSTGAKEESQWMRLLMISKVSSLITLTKRQRGEAAGNQYKELPLESPPHRSITLKNKED
jgi:hypothetical protein